MARDLFRNSKQRFMKILSNGEYFGKYGKVLKIAISKKPNVDKKGLRDPTYSAVITYDNSRSASLAVVVSVC